jgi:hypothetical protein
VTHFIKKQRFLKSDVAKELIKSVRHQNEIVSNRSNPVFQSLKYNSTKRNLPNTGLSKN